MPFRSAAQRRWMFAKHPEMAERWAKETPKGLKLPEKVGEAQEFAPGIPAGKLTLPLPKFDKPQKWQLVIQHHPAARAGDHLDLRLIPQNSQHALSWASKKELPLPGQKVSWFEQPTHTAEYSRTFQGEIAEGYGKTRPGQKVRKVLDVPIEVLQSDQNLLRFNVYYGTGPQEFLLTRQMGKTWLLMNVTKTKAGLKDLPFSKPKYREIKPGAVDLMDASQVMAAKLDGGHVMASLQGSQRPRIFSYREPKERPTGTIEHSQKLPTLYNLRVPKILGDTILRGEVYARTPDERRPVPANVVAGMLNASVWKSRELQEKHGPLRFAAFDVVKFRGKDMSGAGYREKLEALREVQRAVPQLEVPDMAFTPEEKKSLLEAIRTKRHPATTEGVILWHADLPHPPTKVKFKEEHDVHVREVFQAADKSGRPKAEAGGFAFSHEPGGPVVGRVGTGFTQAEKRRMWQNRGDYVGAVARVHAMSKYKSGALEKPSFQGWHPDKQEPGFWEKVSAAPTPDELKALGREAFRLLKKRPVSLPLMAVATPLAVYDVARGLPHGFHLRALQKELQGKGEGEQVGTRDYMAGRDPTVLVVTTKKEIAEAVDGELPAIAKWKRSLIKKSLEENVKGQNAAAFRGPKRDYIFASPKTSVDVLEHEYGHIQDFRLKGLKTDEKGQLKEDPYEPGFWGSLWKPKYMRTRYKAEEEAWRHAKESPTKEETKRRALGTYESPFHKERPSGLVAAAAAHRVLAGLGELEEAARRAAFQERLGRLSKFGSKPSEQFLSKEKRQALGRTDMFFRQEDPGKRWRQFDDDLARKSFAQAVVKDPRADEKLRRHADQMNRLKTGKPLATVVGGQQYYVVRKRGGGLACTCPDWRFRRSVASAGEQDCKHLRAFKAEKKG